MPPLPLAVQTIPQRALTGIAPNGTRAKGSQIITNVVAANGTLPLRVSGSQFYMLASSAAVDIRPMAAGSVGFFDTIVTGTGKNFNDINAFEQLEVKNNNNFAVVFSLFVGWDDYIDKRLIVASNTNPQVAYPTYPTPNAAAIVDITDLSGQAFTDINGGKWYAINRVAILIFNPDTGVTLLVQKATSIVGNGPAVGIVYPQTSLRLDFSGNYRLNLGGANINAVVTEIYNSVVNPIP
jgi:hypothetical protein